MSKPLIQAWVPFSEGSWRFLIRNLSVYCITVFLVYDLFYFVAFLRDNKYYSALYKWITVNGIARNCGFIWLHKILFLLMYALHFLFVSLFSVYDVYTLCAILIHSNNFMSLSLDIVYTKCYENFIIISYKQQTHKY